MTEYLEKYPAPNDEGEPYGGGELCSQCGELYGHGATYFNDGRVVCEECEWCAQWDAARDALGEG